ncbi:chitin synthase 1 [Tachysurus fulvidraco]|uniref:chitin synthase 1 n=1 Tax=Tachysurus fulvidraco TaxID=1234273 RepID=UPI001FEE886B|nr:chitin synthase 1 [Tachysurus fulvidraco]
MEELRNRGQKREGRHRDTWDPFQLNPIGAEKEKKKTCLMLMQHFMAVVIGLLVLTSAVISKGSLLTLATLSSPKSLRTSTDRQFYTLLLMCALVTPNLLVFLKCLWKCAFKSYVSPNMKILGIISAIEISVAVGTSVLVLVVMPQFDVLTNLFISGGVCIGTAFLHAFFRLQHHRWMIIFPICSIVLVSTGYCLLAIDYYVRITSHTAHQEQDCYYYVGIAIFASLLISFNWWENSLQASNKIQDMLSELDRFRDSVFMFTSLMRIAVTVGVYFFYYCLIAENRINWGAFTEISEDTLEVGLGVFFLQIFCSAACHWFGVVACKIHAVRMSFATPVSLTGPVTLIVGITLFLTQASTLDVEPDISYFSELTANYSPIYNPFLDFCSGIVKLKDSNSTSLIILELTNSICKTTLSSHYAVWPFSMLALEGACMWLGLISCSYYVWSMKVPLIERTSQLFVRRLYESAFIDQSLLLNTKMKVKNPESHEEVENVVIYLCATMWHETYDEMLKILTSMFRLDRYRGDPKEEHKNFFEFECHIYVDDAFMKETETDTKLVNSYVEDLINVVIEVYRVFTNKEPDEVSIIDTPYGGRIAFVLPEGNMLYVHLKDKELIRNKKRWSQIMYMYYLLGWKGYIVKNPQKITRQNFVHRPSLISLDGEAYLLPNFDNDSKRKYISDDNTYILALDGDTDFHPSAVILLVDRLRMYANVGAACGRIHPTGMGPMVWYQKFEYAVGHWLQKTAEHVFGCVLCSPGCFSLFRGSALMDDNVLKRYTTKATRASEYVQYDQGEDRWLCTLLLQQGWRVEYNAASDAYTNSPQEFKEFYNQRRRWGPSTLANTLDLLHSGKETVKRNSSISMLYIFYQIFTVASSILGPASVTLMVAGAFQFVFRIEGTLSIIISVIPPVVYMLICFFTKSNFQITIAAILSVFYAFLMTASFFSIIGDMVKEGTFITPTGIFLVSMAILYFVTALLHPQEFGMIVYGLMYFICIPSGYLLLTIYSLVNMNIVSWGTRESAKEKEQKRHVGVLCNRNCKLCCWDVNIQVTQETENLMLQQIQQAVNPNGLSNASSGRAEKETTLQDAEESLNHSETDNNPMENNRGVSLRMRNIKNLSNDKEDTKSVNSTSDFSMDQKTNTSYDDEEEEDEEEYDDLDTYNDKEEQEKEVVPESDWVKPVKSVFLRKLTFANLKRNLQEQIRYTLRNKNQEDLCEELVQTLSETLTEELRDKVGPEDILSESQLEELQDALNESARRILKSNRMQINHMKRLEARVKRAIEKTLVAPQVIRLSEDETDFWNKLIERYLKPIQDPKSHLELVERELKSLRNKAVFLYFIVNVLWVVATFFLQAIGGDIISIKIPKYLPNGTLADEPLKVEPLSLMFLLSFALLLLIQFLAMLYHRVYTFIHVLAYRGMEKDYREKDQDEEAMILENQNVNELVITDADLR